MADIVYEIGAKDKATPTLDKVDKGMSRLEASTKKLGEVSQASLGKLSMSVGSLAKAAGVFAAVDLAIKGLQAAWSGFTGALAGASAAYDTQVEAVKGLETALRLNGEAVETESARLQTYASQMQAFSGVGDEVTLGLMKQAAMLGVSSDQLDDTAAAAIGLAEATGKSLDESLKLVKNSLEGEFGAFGEIIPAIKQATTDSEKLAMIQELAAKGLDAKAESADRLAGAEERAAGAVGDLMEQVGALIAPVREVIAIGIKAMAEALTNILVPAVEWVQAKFEEWKPAIIKSIEDTVNGIVSAITMAEVVYNNFGAVVDMAFQSVALSAETYRADTEHLFTVVIPEYIQWFFDNSVEIFTTYGNLWLTILSNLGRSVKDAFFAIWDFIESGGSTDLAGNLGEIVGRNLLEGFENTIGALPQIADRAMTDTEKALTASIGQTADKLAAEYDAKMASRTVKIGGKIGEDMAKNIDLVLTKKQQEAAAAASDPASALAQLAGGGSQLAALNATESRLLTRGPGGRMSIEAIFDEMLNIARKTYAATAAGSAAQALAASEAREAKEALQRKGSVMFARPPQ